MIFHDIILDKEGDILKLILTVLLLALIPPVDYNKEDSKPEPPVIFYHEEEEYKYRDEDTIIYDGNIVHEGTPKAKYLN